MIPVFFLMVSFIASAAETGADIDGNPPRSPYRTIQEVPSNFNTNKITYEGRGDAKEIFSRMVRTHPEKLWKEPSRFVQGVDLVTALRIQGDGESFPGLRPQLVIQLDLKIGFFHLPVFFEVLEVDERTQHAAFGYVEGNVSQGVQDIQFVQRGEGQFVINHTTRFKSKSDWRDRYLYAYFHEKLIAGFYDRLVGLPALP